MKSIRLIQDDLERSSIFENLADNSSNMNVNLSSGMYKSAPRSASPALLGKSNFPKYYVKAENAIKSITVHNSSTLRLQQIYRDDLTISATGKTVYCVDGKLTSYQVHPSNDYIIVLSNVGFLYIFKLINADLRVKIPIPSLSRGRLALMCRLGDRSFRIVRFLRKSRHGRTQHVDGPTHRHCGRW